MTTKNTETPRNSFYQPNRKEKISVSKDEWKKVLSPEVFHIAQEKGTERPFSGEYEAHYAKGKYYCKACGNALFASNAKFDATCGWPSFFEAIHKDSLIYRVDNSGYMQRTEIICALCEAHLGHVFEDGPKPTGMRYCLNSLSLQFEDD